MPDIFKLPRSLQFLVALSLFNVILFGIFRLVFFVWFNNPNDPVSTDALIKAFYLGLKFDLRLSLLMSLPFILLAWIPALQIARSPQMRKIWLGYFVFSFAAVLSFYMLNIAHYAYLGQMVDASVFRFLADFKTSMGMVFDSYPMFWIILAFIFLNFTYAFVCNKLLVFYISKSKYVRRRRKNALILLTSAFVILFLIYGKLSYYPLRWSDAFFSTHKFASAVASNPIIYFYTTIKNQNIDFDTEKTRQYYDRMVDFLGIKQPDKQGLNFRRLIEGKAVSEKPVNVVMVFLESFASFKGGFAGNPLNPSPNMDALIKESHYFENFYVPKVGTARSVFAALTGLADIESIKTSTRNPLIIDQHIIINDFKPHEKFYFLGGSTSWGNIRGLLSRNIQGLKIYEEGSYESPRVDVWGISDNDLFKEANQVFRNLNGKPFFAVIQTSGDHPPYNIPEWETEFEVLDMDEKTVLDAGFKSVKQFNSFRYLDYSIGQFIQRVKKENYFDNTIFMFFGDHGNRSYPGKHSPKSESQLGLNGNRVPLIIYAPKILPAHKKYQKVASLVDVLPTLAGLAGISYQNTAMGRDLFDPQFDSSRYAFTIDSIAKNKIGLIDEDYYFAMSKDGSQPSLHKLSSDSPRDNIIEQHPEAARIMNEYCSAIYETTKYIRFHNRADK